jgi:hypothetical protein
LPGIAQDPKLPPPWRHSDQQTQFWSPAQAVTWLQQLIFVHCVHWLSPAMGVHAGLPDEEVLVVEEVVAPLPGPWPHAPAHGPPLVVHWPNVFVAWSGLPHCWKQRMKLPGWAV